MNRDGPIRVVVDGSAFVSSIVERVARKSLASCCSFESLYSYTIDFLYWMRSMNIHIEQFYDDIMSDMDKVKTDLNRKKSRINRSKKLIETLNECYVEKPPGNLIQGIGYPRMCHQCVRMAVDAFLWKGNKRRLFACSDPDRYELKCMLTHREIAKYANEHQCYVLTGDYDFAVFPVKGIVDMGLIFIAFERHLHKVQTIPHRKMLSALNLTDLKLIYVAVLRGNDFVRKGTPAFLEEIPKGKRFEVMIEHVVSLPNTKADLIEDCNKQFPRESRSSIEEWFSKVEFKYNTKVYPPFPESCLTQKINNNVFSQCNITRGNYVVFSSYQNRLPI